MCVRIKFFYFIAICSVLSISCSNNEASSASPLSPQNESADPNDPSHDNHSGLDANKQATSSISDDTDKPDSATQGNSIKTSIENNESSSTSGDSSQPETMNAEEKLNLFGYYYSGKHIDEVKDHVNTVWIGSNDWSTADDVTQLLAKAAEANLGIVFDLSKLLFKDGNKTTELLPQTKINSYLDQFDSVTKLYPDIIKMLYIHDEPFLGSSPSDFQKIYDNLDKVLNTLKERYPKLPIGVIYAWSTIVRVFEKTDIKVNEGFTHVGFDCYPSLTKSYFSCGEEPFGFRSIPDWQNALLSYMTKEQKIILVPQAFVLTQNNGTVTEKSDENASAVFDQFFFTQYQNPRVEAIVPFLWQNNVDAKGMIHGVRDLKETKEHLRFIGKKYYK